MISCDGYTCGFGGNCVRDPRFSLSAVPDAAGAFSGENIGFPIPEETAAVARARDILARGKA